MRAIVYALLLTSVGDSVTAEDWRQFRGNDTNSVAADDKLPTTVTKENIAWTADLTGRGLSGPIIVGNRVYLTSSSGYNQDRLHVQCFEDVTGKELWHRQFWATGRTMTHDKMCVATPTPASDGERIFAFYSSNDVACLDLDGNLLWYRGLTYDYPNASNSLGMSSSPVVAGGVVVVQVESDAEAFAMGLEAKTGKTLWKIDRPRRANWTSPCVLKPADGKPELVLLQSSAGLSAVNPLTGEEFWNFTKGASTIPSSTVSGETVYVPSNGITVLKPGEKAFEVAWNEGKLSPSTPSPLVYQGQVFTINRASVLASADVSTGELLWQLRTTGPYSATPVAAGGHLYLTNEKGLLQVVKPGASSGEIVSSYDFGETLLASPAIANGALYLRSDGHLWKIAE